MADNAQYNPNSRYTWKPEDKFEISGQEFGLILNMVRSYLATEEAGKYQVEGGVIKEAQEENSEQPQPTLQAVE